MSQFLKMVSSNDFINTTNIEKPIRNIQNQQLNLNTSFTQVDMKEIAEVTQQYSFVIANTVFS